MWRYALVFPSGNTQIWALVKENTNYRFVNEAERKIMPPVFPTVADALDLLDVLKQTKFIKEWEGIE